MAALRCIARLHFCASSRSAAPAEDNRKKLAHKDLREVCWLAGGVLAKLRVMFARRGEAQQDAGLSRAALDAKRSAYLAARAQSSLYSSAAASSSEAREIQSSRAALVHLTNELRSARDRRS